VTSENRSEGVSGCPPLYKEKDTRKASPPCSATSRRFPGFLPLYKGRKPGSPEGGDLKASSDAPNNSRRRGVVVDELAGLLARGYLRLLTSRSQSAEVAPIPTLREAASSSPNCLDVAAGNKHEWETEGRP